MGKWVSRSPLPTQRKANFLPRTQRSLQANSVPRKTPLISILRSQWSAWRTWYLLRSWADSMSRQGWSIAPARSWFSGSLKTEDLCPTLSHFLGKARLKITLRQAIKSGTWWILQLLLRDIIIMTLTATFTTTPIGRSTWIKRTFWMRWPTPDVVHLTLSQQTDT